MRIGLLGGSFDPVHNAHIEMAKQALRQLHLDEIWFVVAKDTPLKDRKLTAFVDRCKMLQYAIAPYRRFKICTLEATLPGKSYTIDTVAKLKVLYPTYEFAFIVGQDQVAQLHLWKDIDLLQEEVMLCAFERNKQKIETPYQVMGLHMDDLPISSSEVRDGNFKCLHPLVRKYSVENMLYMDFVKKAMSEYRYLHSISVAKTCERIARKQNLDPQKAYLCGLLHDINKEFKIITVEQSIHILQCMRPHLLALDKGIWHGYMARFICEHTLHIDDHDILLAIENHVLGQCRNAYAMLLYVADKLEPTRDYDTTSALQLCEQNLYKGYQLVREQQAIFYGEENSSGK